MTAQQQIKAALPGLHRIAPGGYYIGFRINSGKALIRFNTYDEAWQEYYADHSLVLRDPTVAWALSTTGCCRWSALPIPDSFGVLHQAGLHGLRFGLVVSVGELSSRTVAGFAREDREFSDAEIPAIEATIQRLHHLLDPPATLSRAHAEALRCIAGGKRYAEAADALGISESAFKARLTAARLRLNARTTAEALRRAHDLRLL